MDLCDSIVADVLDALDTDNEVVFFMQIGSNDGVHNDPLRPYVLTGRWNGIMVEPVPYVFARLKRNYMDRENLSLVNAAVTDHDGFSEFYCLAESRDELPEWYDQLGSFALESLLDDWTLRAIPDIYQRITTITVPCITFESLCRKYDVNSLDLVHVDAEGHDLQIIRSIDFRKHRPAVLLYEHKHLSSLDRAACCRILTDNGYLSLELANDTLCVARAAVARLDSRLRSAWLRAQDSYASQRGHCGYRFSH